MISKSFDINTIDIAPFEAASKRLILELSPEMISIILWDKTSHSIQAAEVFSGSYTDSVGWNFMVQQSKLMKYVNVEALVFITHPEMIPIPFPFYDPANAKAQLELFFGMPQHSFVGGDVLEEKDMVLAWQLPAGIHAQLTGHFKVVQLKHIVSSLVFNRQNSEQTEGLIVVYGSLAWVLIWKESNFQMAKAVTFVQPDDLSWNLLNICKQLNLEPTEVSWKVSGMVEDTSPLWQAITRFLDPVESLPSSMSVPDGLPASYYGHLMIAG